MTGHADIVLTLSEPPSANRIWRMGRGKMRKSDEYRDWKDRQAASITQQLGGDCALDWFAVAIVLPPSRRDPDNSIKPIMDALQAGGAVRNDKQMRSLSLRVDDDREAGTVHVALFTAPAPKKTARKRKSAVVR